MITKLPSIVFLAFLVLSGISFLFVLFGIVWVWKTEKRLKRFFLGKQTKDLEETLVILEDNLTMLNIAKERTEKEILELRQKLKRSIQGLEVIRFNPFPDQGSNQSFAIGMLDEERNGVVISSLFGRERMSIFAKPVKAGKSDYELTNEEREVLNKAQV